MLRMPTRRTAPIARFLQVAIARGAFPVRNWEASSMKVTSLTWCRASTVQCPRISRVLLIGRTRDARLLAAVDSALGSDGG